METYVQWWKKNRFKTCCYLSISIIALLFIYRYYSNDDHVVNEDSFRSILHQFKSYKEQVKMLPRSPVVFQQKIASPRFSTSNIPPALPIRSPGIFTSKGELECRRVMESIFKKPFRKARPKFLRNIVTGSVLEIDCCNEELKLGVEYNGRQHYEFVKGMHSSLQDFRVQQYKDYMKNELCKQHKFTLLTIPYTIPLKKIENELIDQLVEHGFVEYENEDETDTK